MKLKGASTVEALMAMILSGIILSAISAGFLFVVRSYDMYTKVNDITNEQLLFTASMNNDFITSDYITKKENFLLFHSSKKGIYTYEFISGAILKKTINKIDTFHIAYFAYQHYMNGKETIGNETLIDAFKLTTEDKSIFFSKVYSADILIKNELELEKTVNNGI